VQHAAFMSAAVEPAVAPNLVWSLNWFASQVTVAPPHFVVSASQHVLGVQVALAPVQCVVAAAVFNVIRIGVTLLQAYPAHVALAVQHRALVLPVTPFLVESRYMPESHTLVAQELA